MTNKIWRCDGDPSRETTIDDEGGWHWGKMVIAFLITAQ